MSIEDFKDILEPFEDFIEIEILGKKVKIPENNSLLRCFQYLSLDSISRGDFCWNRDCLNCQVWLDVDGKEKGVISCRAKAEAGMKICRLHDEVRLEKLGINSEDT